MTQTSSTQGSSDVEPLGVVGASAEQPPVAERRAAEPPIPEHAASGRPAGERAVELRMARLHLRTGSYGLARVELETAAGLGTLDEEALLDLAEVRWRTDDLTGAGEAAAAYIASARVALIALVVAAEATSALGRPGEARRLAGLAIEMAHGSLDDVFAGMPRSDVWPARPVERVAVAALPAAAEPAAASGAPSGAAVAVTMASSIDASREGGEPMPDPATELDAARAALAAGDRSAAALRLSIVLRLAPALAPAVLDVAAGESGPEFDLVRGDALRLVGRETQARRAFASAARQSPDEPDSAANAPADAVARPEPSGGEARSDAGPGL